MSEYSPTRKGGVPKVPEEFEDRGSTPLIGTQSPGVARIEALSSQITTGNRISIFVGVFLIAYAYGLVCFYPDRTRRRDILTLHDRTAHCVMPISLQQPRVLQITHFYLQSTL